MKSFVFLLAVIGVFLAVCSGIGSAQPSDVFTVVTSDQLKKMMDNGGDLVLVDTRTSEEYQEAHIKGAVSIPWAVLSKDSAVLNFPMDSGILFYCNGLT